MENKRQTRDQWEMNNINVFPNPHLISRSQTLRPRQSRILYSHSKNKQIIGMQASKPAIYLVSHQKKIISCNRKIVIRGVMICITSVISRWKQEIIISMKNGYTREMSSPAFPFHSLLTLSPQNEWKCIQQTPSRSPQKYIL